MRRKAATIPNVNGLQIVALIVAPVWMLPAALVNVDWTAGMTAWNAAAVGSIAATSLLTEATIRAETRGRAALFAVAAMTLMLGNTMVAYGNLSHRTNDGRDHRQAQIEAAQRQSSQSSQWSQSRKAAASIAGETPTATLEELVQQAVTGDANRWRATNGCDPAHTTAAASMAFCGELAALRGRLAAAKRRDALDLSIERLHAAATAAPAGADPFADNIADLLAAFGLRLSDAAKSALPAQRDAVRSIGLELMAALGPSAWLLLFAAPGGHTRERRRTSAPRPPVRLLPANNGPTGVNERADFLAFTRSRVELREGQALKAADAWEAWLSWCRERGVAPGTQKRFGMAMARQFERDPNNGRPLYHGVRLQTAVVTRPTRAALALVERVGA